MIRLTKQGVDPKKKVHKFECLNCKAEAECEGSDIVYADRPCGDSYVVCPTCNKHMREVPKTRSFWER